MPFRSIATLESWVDEFEQLGYPIGGAIRVIPQDGEGGGDTGLVAIRVLNSPTEIYIEPPATDQAEWTVMFEPREEPVRLGASNVTTLAKDVAILAALCTFLQQKSDGVSGGNGH